METASTLVAESDAAARSSASMSKSLLTLPPNAGRAIVESGHIIACPLRKTDAFIDFCRARELDIDRSRLIRLERLGVFAPVFRVCTPSIDAPPFQIPIRPGNNWFKHQWAWDTTAPTSEHAIPNEGDESQEGYYSDFQIDHLDVVLSMLTWREPLENYVLEREGDTLRQRECHRRERVRDLITRLQNDRYRRARALLCQFVSEAYYYHTRTNRRTVTISDGGFYTDDWLAVGDPRSPWRERMKEWDPHSAERLFELTREKLRHAYEGLALAQDHCDPLAGWHDLVPFVSVDARARLKGKALRAETLRAGALMLRMLFRDLYGEELKPPDEVGRTVLMHVPELAVRSDARRHLEYVVNRYGLNPQPRLCLMVEGASEEVLARHVFDHYFGVSPGTLGIEFMVLGGVDVATGAKEDRFRAILRLVDYLHHHQTICVLLLDNERFARKLRDAGRTALSIHSKQRFVTRPEYVKVWRRSFEFDNFSNTEIASALGHLAVTSAFRSAEIAEVRVHATPGAALKALYRARAGKELDKMALASALARTLVGDNARRRPENRPIVKVLDRVYKLAALNHLPTMQEMWERNQASKHLGKKRSRRPRARR